jgi:hypothetical protein
MGMAAAKSAMAQGAISDLVAPQKSSINWEEFNFPPYIKLFHLTPGELDEPQKGVCQKIYISWILLVIVLSINLVNTIIFTFSGTDPGLDIMYSIFNLFVGSVIGTYALYCGYTGVGKPDSWSTMKYKVLSIVIGVG